MKIGGDIAEPPDGGGGAPGHYWTAPAGFVWSCSYPEATDTGACCTILRDESLLDLLWWADVNVLSIENANVAMPHDLNNHRSINGVLVIDSDVDWPWHQDAVEAAD